MPEYIMSFDIDENGKLINAKREQELVRCKDCEYGDTFREIEDPEMPMKCLGQHYGGTHPDDFCSYGKRKEDA